jgi:hypothetical protein
MSSTIVNRPGTCRSDFRQPSGSSARSEPARHRFAGALFRRRFKLALLTIRMNRFMDGNIGMTPRNVRSEGRSPCRCSRLPNTVGAQQPVRGHPHCPAQRPHRAARLCRRVSRIRCRAARCDCVPAGPGAARAERGSAFSY